MRTALYAGPEIAHRDDFAGAHSLLTTMVDRARAWRKTRQAIRQLSNFSDTMLKDIGITRGEIEETVRHGRDR